MEMEIFVAQSNVLAEIGELFPTDDAVRQTTFSRTPGIIHPLSSISNQ